MSFINLHTDKILDISSVEIILKYEQERDHSWSRILDNIILNLDQSYLYQLPLTIGTVIIDQCTVKTIK